MYRTTRHLFDRFVFKSHSVHRDWPVKPSRLIILWIRTKSSYDICHIRRTLTASCSPALLYTRLRNIIEQWRRHPLELSQRAKTIIYSPKPGKLRCDGFKPSRTESRRKNPRKFSRDVPAKYRPKNPEESLMLASLTDRCPQHLRHSHRRIETLREVNTSNYIDTTTIIIIIISSRRENWSGYTIVTGLEWRRYGPNLCVLLITGAYIRKHNHYNIILLSGLD